MCPFDYKRYLFLKLFAVIAIVFTLLTLARHHAHKSQCFYPFGPLRRGPCSNLTIFLHQPVTGGTSLGYALRDSFEQGDAPFRECNGSQLYQKVNLLGGVQPPMPYEQFFSLDNSHWQTCNLFMVHEDYSILDTMPCDRHTRVITILRDPVELRWSIWRKKFNIPAHLLGDPIRWIKHKSFDPLLQLRFCAGQSISYPGTIGCPAFLRKLNDDSIPTLRRRALGNLKRSHWIVFTNRLSYQYGYLANSLDLPPTVTIGHANEYKGDSHDIPDHVRVALTKRLKHEIEFIEQARTLMDPVTGLVFPPK